jgi:hypothetical protein
VRGATVQTCQRLIPIPVGWAHMFLDNPPMGVAYRRMLQLMTSLADTAADRRLFRTFGDGVALACGSPNPTAIHPVSVAHSTWKRVAYSKATLSPAPDSIATTHPFRPHVWRASARGRGGPTLGG